MNRMRQKASNNQNPRTETPSDLWSFLTRPSMRISSEIISYTVGFAAGISGNMMAWVLLVLCFAWLFSIKTTKA